MDFDVKLTQTCLHETDTPDRNEVSVRLSNSMYVHLISVSHEQYVKGTRNNLHTISQSYLLMFTKTHPHHNRLK